MGTLICDTGCDATMVTAQFAKRADLTIHKLVQGMPTTAKTANGGNLSIVGYTDVPITIQIMMETENGELVHWNRGFTLSRVLVVDMGGDAQRDLFVAWADFRPQPRMQNGPLQSLTMLVMAGAKFLDTPRAPGHNTLEPARIVINSVTMDGPAEVTTTVDDLRQQILERIAPQMRDTPAATRLVEELLKRAKIFGPINPSELTETVEFKLKPGATPTPVSFKVSARHKSPTAFDGLHQWIRDGNCTVVDWKENSYGHVFVVPKPNGKFRITIDPRTVNESVETHSPAGGYMPDSFQEGAQDVGLRKIGFVLDCTEAFTTLKLGEQAQKLSVFTSPVGKVAFKRGYYGMANMPAYFQQTLMEKVVLPTLREYEGRDVALHGWVDDIPGGANDPDTMVNMLLSVADRLLAIGARLNLKKCTLMGTDLSYCGIAIDLAKHTWRVDPSRIDSLSKIPVPSNREQLTHVLGIIRYYYFATHDLKAQRERVGLLAALDVPGIVLSHKWNHTHTKAMNEAFLAIQSGKWALCYDPRKPVYITTDAAGSNGYCIACHQLSDITGELVPIAFYSHGWIADQLKWGPQKKEAYAVRQAACYYALKHYPFARIILLCDNKNLAKPMEAGIDSADVVIQRWLWEVECTGFTRRSWVPGFFNTIADFGSRAINPEPHATLSDEEKFDLRIFSITTDTVTPLKEGETPTMATVPHHITMAPLVRKVIEAQQTAVAERETWKGRKFNTVHIDGLPLVLHEGRMVIPSEAKTLKQVLLQLAHDDSAHYRGAERTLWALQNHAHVYWHYMRSEVQLYVDTCARCQFVKQPHGQPDGGQLHPTQPKHVHATWYVDLKGVMPHDTGYILMAVEAYSRVVKLRYLPNNTAKEVLEELEEVGLSFGTYPDAIRSDGGQPFESEAYKTWCGKYGITPITGLAGHSRGQAMVESRFKGLADALMASLGGKADTQWFKPPHLARLEAIMNSTIVEPLGGSPMWILTGREPRTLLSAATDWSNPAFGKDVIGFDGMDFNTYCNIIASHHDNILRIQQRAGISTTLAQAMTKQRWDKTHAPTDFKPDQWVLMHRVAPNRLKAHFVGPYIIKSMVGDGNSAMVSHVFTPDTIEGPVHVARLIHFNQTRTTLLDLSDFLNEEGQNTVEAVEDHRQTTDGSYEFLIRWYKIPMPTWVQGYLLNKVRLLQQYSTANALPAHHKAPAQQPTSGRARKTNKPQ